MFPRTTIEEFDKHLANRGLALEAVVVGGSALALLGLTDRQTRDFDILHPALSPQVEVAAAEFAALARAAGTELGDDWLNNGPAQLTDVLPPDWDQRLRPVYAGRAVQLTTLGRSDLLRTKLFALCDRGTDLPDCLALRPTPDELDEASAWVAAQDANKLWPEHVKATLADLAERLADGV
jgi:hypothetical protein